ncbi:DUF927 domain-containing protein [Aggregatibacter actinomycetemcomitans]|uniref:DUF927 domain-containing protein n=1 Tax=Aggregatibacter actinomycetemcomitans TaxID=714 RepID=UPI001F12218F|nr:DUF927 domain-containing protein [Aggregatibacter actinomycetemcomitans]
MRLTKESTHFIRLCVFGEFTESQKSAVLLNLSKYSKVEKVQVCDSLGQQIEDCSDYVARLRIDEESQQRAAEVAKLAEIAEAPKTSPYVEFRELNNINGLFLVTPKLDKDTGEILREDQKWICSNVDLVGQGKNEQGEYYYLFKWRNPDEREPRLEAVHLADFGTEAGWKQLKGKGLKMTQGQGLIGKLTEHFHNLSNTAPCDYKITKLAGWQNGAYLLPSSEMIGEPTSPIFFTEKSGADLGYTVSGTLESWQQEIANNVKGNPSMMIGVAVALAAPMLAILGRESFGVHLFAESSKGKSTTLHIANSIYGNPDKLKLSWSTTAVGIKNEATARNDGFITLDEIGQAKDAKNLEAIAYDLFNETGKLQGKKEGGNREINRWKVSALSTGEKDLETQLRLQGVKVHAGQLVRLLNIPLNEAYELHQFSNNKAHADHLNEMVLEHFGAVGREWIAYLSDNKALVRETYKTIRKKWLDLASNMSGQVQRVAGDRFAILETALQLAKHLTLWSEEENGQAMLKNFLNWKEDFGENSREETKITETLLEALYTYEASFIEYPPTNKPTPREIYGIRVLEYSTKKEPEYFFIYHNAFSEILKEFPIKLALNVLANAGILKTPRNPEKGYEYRTVIPRKIAGSNKKIRAYKITPITEDEQAEE